MLYEKITGRIGVDMPEFLEWTEKKYVPFVRRSGAKLIGYWTTITGNVGQFVEIWAYDDFAAAGESSKYFHLPSNEEDRQTYKEIPKYHKDVYIEFLRGGPLSPTKDVRER